MDERLIYYQGIIILPINIQSDLYFWISKKYQVFN